MLLLSVAALMLAACSHGRGPESFSQRVTTAATSDAPHARKGIKADGIYTADLPPEARRTLQLIKGGGPFPFAKDGAVFGNREAMLLAKPYGYYHEYTVITPGTRDRGARRIIVGMNKEYYYTDDHYRSFKRIGSDE
jgi:ribonuclease T1